MTRHHRYLPLLILLIGISLISGCSSENSGAVFGAHPDGWLSSHSVDAQANVSTCTSCHGADYNGSGQIPGCFDCHLGSAPTFTTHPTAWAIVATDHQGFPAGYSWTTCATAACHGTDLKGGASTAPSCFITVGCHTTPGNYPQPHGGGYSAGGAHGLDAKNLGQLYCRNCHGTPFNNFDGGFMTDASVGLNITSAACSSASCHPDAKAHPTDWQGDNDQDLTYLSTHRTVNQTIVDTSCSLCHKTTAVGSGPLPAAPSCFSGTFTNANSSVSGCHPNGPGVAPHATNGTYRDENNHGPDAKTDLGLNYCKTCHAQPDGSNYRFNVNIGSLNSGGCEECHAPFTAHPDADRWTFRGTSTSTRRTHFAAATPLTNCTLCHGANLTGGSGPSCYSCHDLTAAPDFKLVCNACHGIPPDNTATIEVAPTAVNHFIGIQGDVSAITNHNSCYVCHGANDDTTGTITNNSNGNYILFDRTNAPQGGDHLDGQIEMNGPSPSTGAAYDPGTQGCNLACHLNDAAHQLPNNSGLNIEYGNYGGGSGQAGCDGCHGYPPDGNTDLAGGTPVSHLFGDNGATLLSNHNECQTCHGTKDDGSGNHSPAANYNPVTDHNTTPHEIQINSSLQYVSNPADLAFGGCNNSCHGNDGSHRFPNSSGLTIVEADFGGITCSSCHDTGANGAPIVKLNDSHATSACESCHPGGLVGGLHSDGGNLNVVLIPNNTTVGINYSANGEAGIYLGGNNTTGTTEAEICWNCHNQVSVNADWRNGDDYNNTTAGYTISSRNWTLANFQPPGNILPNRPVASIHSVNDSAPNSSVGNNVSAGVINITSLETAGDIRCSYCHDVHDLNVLTSDSSSGKPYLRGTWRGNPYGQERPPQSGETWTGNSWSHFGGNTTPRLRTDSVGANTGGGYQIDQNNSYPTSGWTLAGSAGLCTLCHGSNVNSMDYYGSSLWIGTNGHSNSTIGGTGSNASDLFDARDRDGNLDTSLRFYMAGQGADTPNNDNRWGDITVTSIGNVKRARVLPHGQNAANAKVDDGNSAGLSATPPRYTGYWGGTAGNARAVENMPADYSGWYASGVIGSKPSGSSRAHDFSCSKCHSPHAAGLPALLITNCLDYTVSTWSAQGRNNAGNIVTIGPTTTNQWAKEAMNNCHRKNGATTGWNNLNAGQ